MEFIEYIENSYGQKWFIYLNNKNNIPKLNFNFQIGSCFCFFPVIIKYHLLQQFRNIFERIVQR
jgi:hypothetical protein